MENQDYDSEILAQILEEKKRREQLSQPLQGEPSVLRDVLLGMAHSAGVTMAGGNGTESAMNLFKQRNDQARAQNEARLKALDASSDTIKSLQQLSKARSDERLKEAAQRQAVEREAQRQQFQADRDDKRYQNLEKIQKQREEAAYERMMGMMTGQDIRQKSALDAKIEMLQKQIQDKQDRQAAQQDFQDSQLTKKQEFQSSENASMIQAKKELAALEAQRKALPVSQRGKGKNQNVDGQRLPPDKVLSVNEGNNIPMMLQDIQKTIEANAESFGPIQGRMHSLNPYDELGQTIQSQTKAASQAFGRFMEGGVLRKEDEDKYAKMFPQLSDTPEVASNKLQIVNRLLSQKQLANIRALQDQGYSTQGLHGISETVQNPPSILSSPSAKPPVDRNAALEELKRRGVIK